MTHVQLNLFKYTYLLEQTVIHYWFQFHQSWVLILIKFYCTSPIVETAPETESDTVNVCCISTVVTTLSNKLNWGITTNCLQSASYILQSAWAIIREYKSHSETNYMWLGHFMIKDTYIHTYAFNTVIFLWTFRRTFYLKIECVIPW